MSVKYLESSKVLMLNTSKCTYAMKVSEEGELIHLYWGAKIICENDLPSINELRSITTLSMVEKYDCREYVEWGRNSYLEPALKVEFADGTRGLRLVYKEHLVKNISENVQKVSVILKDTVLNFEAELVYKIIFDLDIIERSVIIRNIGKDALYLDRAFSASLFLPYRENYRLTNFGGAWAHEYQKKSVNNISGQIVMQSRTGLSGPEFVPFFMLDENANANERSGEVYFATLEWSGNWKILIDKDIYNRTLISAGISDFDFRWCLDGGEQFETPVFAIGYTQDGFGAVTNAMHAYEKEYIMAEAEKNREIPLVYNAYGSFFSQINEQKIMGIIDKASSLGVELFVMDAGWTGYGDDTTYTYSSGFGDWEVNKDRFPNGLKPISDAVHKSGMKFGMWMEPEAVSPESKLYKNHPDWICEFNGRKAEIEGKRYVLNFAEDAAAEYMTNRIINLIEEYKLDYFKMDFCRMSVVMAWKNKNLKHQKEVWVRYVLNLYKCYSTIKKKFPNILIENCASGGFRADLGMLSFAGRMNRSDNQDPMDVLKLHEGFCYFLLPKLAGGGCHISDVFTKHINGRISTMKFQAYVGMMGSLAIGKNLNTITDEEYEELKEYIKLYKEIRPIVHNGIMYRIESAFDKPYSAYLYVYDDNAVLFAFSACMQFAATPENFRLCGLEKDAKYDVGEYGIRSGSGLMNVGLQIKLRGDMDCKIIKITKIK